MFVYLQVLNLLTGCLWITNSISSEAKQTNRSKSSLFRVNTVSGPLTLEFIWKSLLFYMLCALSQECSPFAFNCDGKIDDLWNSRKYK